MEKVKKDETGKREKKNKYEAERIEITERRSEKDETRKN